MRSLLPPCVVFALGALGVVAPVRTQGTAAFAGEAVNLPDPAPVRFAAVLDPLPLPNSPWRRYFTTDDLGRTIVFYASQPSDGTTPLPVIVYVQGSGSQSVFTRLGSGDSVRASASGGQGSVRQAAKDRAIVVIAEKPGVRFMERPTLAGGGEEGSQQFRDEHTLERWCAAVSATLHAALTLPRADRTRVLLDGHSEGGLVACKVTADNPVVTHVATLAGGGPSQLFDLVELARRGIMCGSKPRTPDECVQWLLLQWDEVLVHPQSADLFFLGHPHRRWTTFLATCPMEELKKTPAKVFVGQGTDDRATALVGADMVYASLRALGREVVYSRVPGDHAFMVDGPASEAKDADGWQAMHDRVVAWFLGG